VPSFTQPIPAANENASASGDLDLKRNVTIKGGSGSSTVIDGNNLDRIFQVLGGKLSISNATIEHGRAGRGAGIRNSGGQVTLSSVRIVDNKAVVDPGLDGACGSGGTAVGGNGASGASGGLAECGGVFNAAGSMSISNGTISSNLAQRGGGGNGGLGGFGGGVIGAAGLRQATAAGRGPGNRRRGSYRPRSDPRPPISRRRSGSSRRGRSHGLCWIHLTEAGLG
jgi:hypothetical protein